MRWAVLSLVAVLLGGTVLIPRGVRAEAQQGMVQMYVRSARQLYDNLEYERALEQLSRARAHSTGEADDVLLSLYEGVLLADLGKNEASTTAFKAALLLQPEAKLPVKVSPKVERRFEDVRRQVRRKLANQAARGVDPGAPPGLEPGAQARPVEETPAVVASQSMPVAQAEPSPASAEVSGRRGLRERAWIPAAVGGALLVGGGVSYLQSRHERSRLRNDDESIETVQDLDRSVSRGRTSQTVGLVLAGAGVVGLGVSAGMYLLGAPSAPAKVGWSLGTDGTSALVFGRWP
ncbi:hypothetical protein [Corallococcus sicarius]|nr:hypothetical protein [Corallococcus sicarius]